MHSKPSRTVLTIRATLTSYIVLCGIWLILASAYMLLSYRTHGESLESGVAIAGSVGLGWAIWLRGFRITIFDRVLEYRNGFYRSSSLRMNEIVKIENKWIEWGLLGRRIRVPRMAVISQDRERSIQINPKPFGRHDLRRIHEMLERDVKLAKIDEN